MGNSWYRRNHWCFPAVHPHACGELCQDLMIKVICHGSSPRLWGTHLQQTTEELLIWFIPTLVGNSEMLTWKTMRKTVHPHACGELPYYVVVIASGSGSSPRLWGTRNEISFDKFIKRFIPTLVGNSIQRGNNRNMFAVHPHACGELEMK